MTIWVEKLRHTTIKRYKEKMYRLLQYCSGPKITIIVLPDGSKKVRQFRFNKYLKHFILLFLITFTISLAALILDYKRIKSRMPQFSHLQFENAHRDKQLLFLAERIHRMTQKMNRLGTHEPGLKILADSGIMSVNGRLLAMGGSGPNPFEADYSLDYKHRELVRLMHSTLDRLNREIDFLKASSIRRYRILREREELGTELTDISVLGNIPSEREKIYEHLIETALDLGLEPRLALGMAKVESDFDPTVVSPKGAVGVLQVMPHLAWNDFNVPRKMLFDPQINIQVGLSWMKYLLDRFDQNVELSLAAYNAGASRIVKSGYRIPSIKETQVYVQKVKQAMDEELP